MKNKSLVFSTGCALFSMYFGSGNLVFPIVVGQQCEGSFFLASLGILTTGVIFPLLGMLGITLYNGSIESFFSSFGKKGVFLFSLLCLALMGPFGVLARCLTVIHGAMQSLVPGMPLVMTSFVTCLLIYFLAVNRNKIVSILGSVLTPFLLLSIAAIVFFALVHQSPNLVNQEFGMKAFSNGFFQGYQTMDLVASFFFSGFVITHLNRVQATTGVFLKASFVGASLLYAVYFALVLLGWLYASELQNVAPQEMLGRIAQEALGSFAAPCVCMAVVLACLTTAIALATLFADFLQKEVTKERLGNKAALVVTLLVAFFVSTLDFAGIASFLGPILATIYPSLVALTVVNIASRLLSIKATHWPFTLTLAAKLCWV